MFLRLIICVLAAASLVRAEMIISQSRQFVVHASGRKLAAEKPPAGAVEVVPELLVVTAERVKQALTAEIPALANARTPIHIGVVDSAGVESMVGVASSRYEDGWKYNVAVPRVVEEARLVKGLLSVLVLEYANRGAERGAELPAWLTEGLAEELVFSVGPKLVVGRAPNAWEASTRDLHHWTREMLRTNATPSFQDLTTASVPPRGSAQESVYLASTHLLVHSLLDMPNGRQNFAKFLQGLSRTWNWQTAFREGFGFARMLDVEKWWSLTVVDFTTRDMRQAWAGDMSVRKLDEVLMTRVEYRNATNALPETRLVDLNTIFDESNAALLTEALNDKITQLSYTAPHMTPQVGALALEYKNVFESFLKRRDVVQVQPGLRTTAAAQRQALAVETARRLAALDQRRRLLAEQTVSSRR
ncbi:MAG TPA: hypothetical protein VM680_09555 [Verrucomicrobiae bacterium]|nr:hypothetical protein [Verrucomicrobiae bacterium]